MTWDLCSYLTLQLVTKCRNPTRAEVFTASFPASAPVNAAASGRCPPPKPAPTTASWLSWFLKNQVTKAKHFNYNHQKPSRNAILRCHGSLIIFVLSFGPLSLIISYFVSPSFACLNHSLCWFSWPMPVCEEQMPSFCPCAHALGPESQPQFCLFEAEVIWGTNALPLMQWLPLQPLDNFNSGFHKKKGWSLGSRFTRHTVLQHPRKKRINHWIGF